jgi:hypothetical protein
LDAALQLARADLPATVDLQDPIRVIRSVEPGGKGSSAAALAYRKLAKAEIGRVTEILAGMDGANSLARNWLCSALDQVVERAHSTASALPIRKLEEFLLDTRHDPQARRLAYEFLCETDKTTSDRFLPNMLEDPNPELRHEAINRVFDQAEKLGPTAKKEELLALYRRAFAAAREKDQIDRAVRKLRGFGEKIDLATHLGLIVDWTLIGPFPNAGKKGIDTVYPPEQKLDTTTTYESKQGKLRWCPYVSNDEYGIVNLNKGIGEHKEAIAYATTEFTSRAARDAEIRVGCYTPFKVWVNGELVLVRGDAYTGMNLDHYVARAHFKAGKNVILVKVAKDLPVPGAGTLWQFQLRVCDSSGVALLSALRVNSITKEEREKVQKETKQ